MDVFKTILRISVAAVPLSMMALRFLGAPQAQRFGSGTPVKPSCSFSLSRFDNWKPASPWPSHRFCLAIRVPTIRC